MRDAAGRRFRRITGWAAPVGLALVYLTVADLRPGLNSLFALGYVLVLWFVLARTKTLSGQAVAGLFTLGLPWAVIVGWLSAVLTHGPAGLAVADLGAATGLAAMAEPSLILLPLLILTLVRPIRVRGFSATDWLLAGLTIGASFQVVEELGRLSPGTVPVSAVGAASVGPARYGFGPLSGGLSLGDAHFAGRAVTAALVTVAVGLAIAAWRHTGNPGLSPIVRIGWRALAVLMPLGAWWLAVSAQAGWNATVLSADRWLDSADPSTPWPLRLGWRFGQHGSLLGPLLLVLFVAALLVDAVRLRNAAERGEDPLPYPFAPARTADRWAGRLTGWAGTRTALPVAAAVWVIAAGCAVVAYAVRDLIVVLVAPGRPRRSRPDSASGGEGETRRDVEAGRDGDLHRERESRWAAVDRARQAGVLVRMIRAEAMALAAGPDTVASRRLIRGIGAIGLLAVLLAVFWLAPHWATGIGDSVTSRSGSVDTGAPTGPTVWLAGVPAAQSTWWSTLALWEYVVLVLGAISLVLFTAAPFDPALFGGRSVWLMSRAPSAHRHPEDRRVHGYPEGSRAYLAGSSPLELLVDGVGALLSVLPERLTGRLAGAGTGPEVRAAVRQFASAPSAFIIDRRVAARLAARRSREPVTVGGPSRSSTGLGELPPIKLADGRLLSPLTEDDRRLFVAALDELARDLSSELSHERRLQPPDERSAAAQYHSRIYGDDERLVSLRPEKWSGVHNTAYGMLTSTAYYDGHGPSWYVPETLPETIRHKAYRELDRRLIELATVVYYPANPFRALEITTNHPLVAQTLEERMARLAIPGYVVVES